MTQFTHSIIAMALISTLTACGGSGSDDTAPTSSTKPTTPVATVTEFEFSATEMITNLTDDVIISGYATLAQKGEEMLLATKTLVTNKTQVNLIAAQAAWTAARQPWEQGEAHIFGPVDSLNIDPHLDDWPLNTSDLTDVLANNSGFDAKMIKGFNDDLQGFHTIEYLLFGDGVLDNEKSVTELTVKESEYLAALAEVFRDYTKILDDAWQVSHDGQITSKPYGDFLKKAGSENHTIYQAQLGVIEELINGMIGIVNEVRSAKIANASLASIALANTSKVESQYSWNSLTDFSDNIIGVRNLYQGEFEGATDKQGIIDFVKAADPLLALRVVGEIDDAIAKIKAISGTNNMPFRQAILDVEGRVRIQTAIDALSILETSLTNDVLTLLKKWK
ncbi:iron-regulated protein A precursor [Shewanella sp. VB17]|uniref:imelysin family protein n=1 Tax=Shewanella sp. VB17 TaxID=2739432 RepID=UPI0015635B7F|nr:imelysin family protein [Shewanella sp. VB17]NRD72520.1 iron-regulated protein A precursor [Shewanella sp. VB17]